MAEHSQIDSVGVQKLLKGYLARRADVAAAASAVPSSVSSDNHPRCNSSVDRGQVSSNKLQLLISEAERASVQVTRAARSVRGISEVSLGIDHGDMNHSIIKRVPEGSLS